MTSRTSFSILQSNTPENLLDGGWKGLERSFGLGCGQPHQLGSGEGESSRNKYTTEALEAVLERARIIPQSVVGVR